MLGSSQLGVPLPELDEIPDLYFPSDFAPDTNTLELVVVNNCNSLTGLSGLRLLADEGNAGSNDCSWRDSPQERGLSRS